MGLAVTIIIGNRGCAPVGFPILVVVNGVEGYRSLSAGVEDKFVGVAAACDPYPLIQGIVDVLRVGAPGNRRHIALGVVDVGVCAVGKHVSCCIVTKGLRGVAIRALPEIGFRRGTGPLFGANSGGMPFSRFARLRFCGCRPEFVPWAN